MCIYTYRERERERARESEKERVQIGTKMNQKYLIGLGDTITDTHIMNLLVPGRSFSVVWYEANSTLYPI